MKRQSHDHLKNKKAAFVIEQKKTFYNRSRAAAIDSQREARPPPLQGLPTPPVHALAPPYPPRIGCTCGHPPDSLHSADTGMGMTGYAAHLGGVPSLRPAMARLQDSRGAQLPVFPSALHRAPVPPSFKIFAPCGDFCSSQGFRCSAVARHLRQRPPKATLRRGG